MADEKKSSIPNLPSSKGKVTEVETVAPSNPEPDWEVAASIITDIEQELLAYVGKPGHNPFIWKHDMGWKSLKASIDKKNPAAFQKLISIKRPVVPVVNMGTNKI